MRKEKTLFFVFSLMIILLAACTKIPERNMESQDGLLNQGNEIITQDLAYFENSIGYLARPKTGNYPGVIMIHEWWGLNQNIKDTAEKLAADGYVVLAVDLYSGKVASTPEEARTLTSSVNQNKSLDNLRAAMSYLKTEQKANKIASLGWCFGGGQSMQLALNEELDATIIYYGNLVTDESRLKSITWPVLGVFGREDQSIKVETVNQFDSVLDKLMIENEIYVYDGVGHAFANPSNAGHDPIKTQDAWEKTVAFLEKHIKA